MELRQKAQDAVDEYVEGSGGEVEAQRATTTVGEGSPNKRPGSSLARAWRQVGAACGLPHEPRGGKTWSQAPRV